MAFGRVKRRRAPRTPIPTAAYPPRKHARRTGRPHVGKTAAGCAAAFALAVVAGLSWGWVPTVAQEIAPDASTALVQVEVYADAGRGDVRGQAPVPGSRAFQPAAPLWHQAFVPERAQIVSFYGYPGVPVMGMLGHDTPDAVAELVAVWAGHYDRLNGPRGAVPAFHLITGVAQASPTPDGTWLRRLSHERIGEYVEAAREHGMLLFLDTQIGWSDPLVEVRLLEPFLREPFVHVALDPEFATRPLGFRPGLGLGYLTGTQVNEVQHYLAALVQEEGLPPKILMVHQFAGRMLRERETIEDYGAVELSVDMDGFGHARAKLYGYERYALSRPSERPALKLFFKYDTPVMTPEQVQGLEQPPDLIIYQ